MKRDWGFIYIEVIVGILKVNEICKDEIVKEE